MLLTAGLLLIGSSACSQLSSTGDEQSEALVFTQCAAGPRPQICTMDYRPVCATLDNGEVAEYANGCGACADENVAGWVEGQCPVAE